jgi:enoyl-CoA hydratase/carnithine racemase
VNAPASDEGPPRLALAQGVAWVRLRRPSQRNSLHDEDLHRLLDIFAQVEADPAVRVVVLTAETGAPASGRRPVFCAGYHVGGFDSADHDPRLFERVPDALERLRPLTICALNGSVYGGATDLVLACDLRMALAGSEFRMPAAALGLHYYPSGLRRYVSRLGLQGAKRAFLTAKALPVESPTLCDLFEAIAPAQAFDAAVAALVQDLAGLAPLAAQATKQSLGEIAAGEYDPARLREREAMTAASADFAEGRAAMAARRAPRFIGQ